MDTKEKLIMAALRQFEARGFAAATTKAIAEDAGVAEVTLFRLFGDKRTLFGRVVRYVADEFGLMHIAAIRPETFQKDVMEQCELLLRHFIRHNALIRMLIFEMKKDTDVHAALMVIRNKGMENLRTQILAYRSIADEQTVTDCMEWLLNSLIGSSLCYRLFHDGEDAGVFAHTHATLITDAFCDQLRTIGK